MIDSLLPSCCIFLKQANIIKQSLSNLRHTLNLISLNCNGGYHENYFNQIQVPQDCFTGQLPEVSFTSLAVGIAPLELCGAQPVLTYAWWPGFSLVCYIQIADFRN